MTNLRPTSLDSVLRFVTITVPAASAIGYYVYKLLVLMPPRVADTCLLTDAKRDSTMGSKRLYRVLVSKIALLELIAAFSILQFNANADWPGLLGPTRNGQADSASTIPTAIGGAPKQIWKVDAGQGYAGPAVAGNDCILYERDGDNDRVRLVNIDTGKEIWRRELRAGYSGGIDSDKGPRSVPTVLNDSILVYSAAGDLSLLERKDGSLRWTRPLRKEYQAEDGYFGAGNTPLVVGDSAIVNIGARTASVVCVSLSDGKTIWTSSDVEASYASPILIRPSRGSAITGPIVVVPTKLKTLGLDLGTGKQLWEFPFGQRGPTVNAATPIMTTNGNIFQTSSYGNGSVLVSPTQSSAKIIRKGTDISSQYSTPVVVAGKIFGSDGREDGGEGAYKCLQASDGKLLWEQSKMPICHTIGVGDKLLILGIGGEIWTIASSATKFESIWKSNIPKGKYRALPAYSGNRLYTRSSNGSGDSWYCFQIGD